MASLRVLCFHGFRTNSKILQDQTRDLQRLLGPRAEFVFLNGPLEAKAESDPTVERVYAEHKPFYEWWRQQTPDGVDLTDAIIAAQIIQEKTAGRHGPDRAFLQYEGLEDTMKLVHEQVQRQGPFDIALGFSQGSLMATTLSMWYWKFQQHHKPWKLNLCFNGYSPYGANAQHLFYDEQRKPVLVPFPSVHVLGTQDPMHSDGLRLAQMYQDMDQDGAPMKQLLEHDGGHRLPSAKRHPQVYASILQAIGQHCC